jgi:mycofactocin precursor
MEAELLDGVETLSEDARVTDAGPDEALVEDELLVEEISIDGMCGVY